ncbi:MAG: excinuclease ABC subunit UvrC, partial [Rikenellaceae bacterium]
RVMVSKIASIHHTVVESETDALLLENNMIKDLRPRYNIMLKDDKTYPWIEIRNEYFPRLVSTRRPLKDGSRHFGPYSSVFAQKIVLETMHSIYQLRTCSLNLDPKLIAQGRYAPCLQYHIGNCKAPCIGLQSQQEYKQSMDMVVQTLKGDFSVTTSYLEQMMTQAAEKLQFETAEHYHKRIEVLRNFQQKSIIVSNSFMSLDVFSLLFDETGMAYCNYLHIKKGAIISSLTVEVVLGVENTQSEALAFAIARICEQMDVELEREVVVPFMPDKELFKQSIKFTVPSRGDKAQLLELSEKNCRLFRLEKLKQLEVKDPQRHSERIMASLQKELCLDTPPHHMECFDNSNLQGTNAVAACVVFRDGKPSRKEYRHYNIKTVVGADDFASMHEIITRRYTRLKQENQPLPDLIVVDGGKGQLSMAMDALKKLEIFDKVQVIGLAKRIEEVYFPNDPTAYFIDRNSPALKVLMHIRNEAHRFGITFHRNKRSANFIKSELESISGLGAKSIEKLLKEFGSVQGVKQATPEQLKRVVGLAKTNSILEFYNRI